MTSETARREFLIAPILIDLIHHTKAKLRVSYLLNISEQLKGSLDYYLRTQNSLLIIEAKNEDLQRGFVQLAVELIALDQLLDASAVLVGAVTTGNIWQFARFDRQARQFTQDLTLYRVPTDLEDVLRILVRVLLPLND